LRISQTLHLDGTKNFFFCLLFIGKLVYLYQRLEFLGKNEVKMGKIERNLLIIFIFLLNFANFAADIDFNISPQPLIKGQRAQLEITSSEDKPELMEFPDIDGIRWLGKGTVSSQTEIINFKVSKRYTVTYNFLVEKEGEIKFPQLKIKIGNKKTIIDAFSVDAILPQLNLNNDSSDSSSPASLEKYLFVHAKALSDKNEFYVGEEIPFEITVYCISGMRVEYSWPEIDLQNIIFHDFSQVNKENAKFAGYITDSQNINGKTYNAYHFRTAFKATTPGILSGEVKVNTRIKIPRRQGNRRRFSIFDFDEFPFDPFSEYEVYDQVISCKINDIKILSLPEKTNQSDFIGLIGDWNLNFVCPEQKFRTGETFSLKINIEGKGGLDNLRAPEIKIDGFRIYPPEIRKSSKSVSIKEDATIEYLILPLKEGEREIDISLSTFSTKDGKYKQWEFSKKINVEKGEETQNSTFIAMNKTPDNQNLKPVLINDNKNNSADILYLKKKKYGTIKVPVWKNNLLMVILIAMTGPLVLLFSEIFQMIKNRKISPVELRKREALAKRKKLLKKAKNLNEEEINKFIREEFCPWLNDLRAYPPGTSPEEIINLIDDKELSRLIEDAASSAFMPGVSKLDFQTKRNILLKKLKSIYPLFILCISLLIISVANAQNFENKLSIKQNPYELFDKGNFMDAAIAFSADKEDLNDPYVLYNIGCCFYRMGKFPDALFYFEKANLLLPRDSDILENLNHTRKKLELPEKGIIESPSDIFIYCRDLFRPDEWLILASLSFMIFFVLLCLRKKIPFEYLCVFIIIAIFAIGIAIFAAMQQFSGDYSKTLAIIRSQAANIHVLPSDSSEKIKIILRGGEKVKIVEERSDWIRIRINSNEGWIRNNNIKKIWN